MFEALMAETMHKSWLVSPTPLHHFPLFLQKQQQQQQELKAKEVELMRGNRLLNNPTSFNMKRRWDDDVVFKNQARGETTMPKRFINDVIQNHFHHKFSPKYMK
ncbi:hypothetical protein Ancab_024905 [Ancistrocladus abbreviatus]